MQVVEGIEVARRSPFGDNPLVGTRGAKTQQRILRAALDVFAKHGYHDSRIEQITEAAGCSRPTFYQYFSSKEDVFRALASYVGRSVVQMTEHLGAVTPDADGREALAGWMRTFTDFYDDHAPVFTSFSAAVRTDAGLASGSAVVSHGFGRALRPHLQVGADPVDHEVMASVVVTMIVRANLLRIGSAGLVGRHRFIKSLADLLHRVLLGPQAALDGARRPAPARMPPRLRGEAPASVAASPSARRPLSAQGEQMRQRLLDAGASVLLQRGFHDTRVDDVCTAAGASHGTFYRYFDSKEELFGALADQAVTPLIESMGRFPVEGDARVLREWLTDWFGVYAEHGAIIAVWREAEFEDPQLDDLTQRVADAALGGLYRVLAQHGVGDPLVNAMAFLGLLETIPHHVHAFGYFGEDDAIDALATIIRRGFLGV